MQRGDPLSQREIEVVALLIEGKNHVQIGFALGISENTVHCHMHHIQKKMGVPNSVAVAVQAIKRGIV